eukprot:1111449-Pyramimonas_sp.AAC.1
MARVSRIEGGSFSIVALAWAPRQLVLNIRKSFTDWGRFLFNMRLSPSHRARTRLTIPQEFRGTPRTQLTKNIVLEGLQLIRMHE